MRHMALALAMVAACGGNNNEKKDAPDNGDSGPLFDAPPLIACTPKNGTTVSVRSIGQVAGSALLATSPPNDGRLFVVEQAGRIRIFENEMLKSTPFLDISSSIAADAPPGERGLLGLAFSPKYASNREFYVFYNRGTCPNNCFNVVARYHQSATDPNVADTNGEEILVIKDFADNHNGGMIEFGKDGYLYIGTGDGGAAGDPCHNAQATDRTAGTCTAPPGSCPVASCEPLLGKILRIDVNTTSGLKPYGIPSTNPFAAGGGEPEIFIIGVRNPWRWSFDRLTGDLYIADVGQGTDEELTVLAANDQAGKNLGWSMYEATRCYGNYTCSPTGKTMPQFERNHNVGWLAIIGGEVYRGNCFPDMKGTYFMTDNAAHELVRATFEANGSVTTTSLGATWPNGPASLHSDARGELFLTTTNGSVYQIEAGP